MATATLADRCPLCGSPLHEEDAALHLRLVHEVLARERTVADVPEPPPVSLRFAPKDNEEELLLATH